MKPCGCPICATNDALRVLREAAEQIDAASNAWVEHGAEEEMALYYLHDEVTAVLAMPWWKRRAAWTRLAAALTSCKPSAPWQNAVRRHDWADDAPLNGATVGVYLTQLTEAQGS